MIILQFFHNLIIMILWNYSEKSEKSTKIFAIFIKKIFKIDFLRRHVWDQTEEKKVV